MNFFPIISTSTCNEEDRTRHSSMHSRYGTLRTPRVTRNSNRTVLNYEGKWETRSNEELDLLLPETATRSSSRTKKTTTVKKKTPPAVGAKKKITKKKNTAVRRRSSNKRSKSSTTVETSEDDDTSVHDGVSASDTSTLLDDTHDGSNDENDKQDEQHRSDHEDDEDEDEHEEDNATRVGNGTTRGTTTVPLRIGRDKDPSDNGGLQTDIRTPSTPTRARSTMVVESSSSMHIDVQASNNAGGSVGRDHAPTKRTPDVHMGNNDTPEDYLFQYMDRSGLVQKYSKTTVMSIDLAHQMFRRDYSIFVLLPNGLHMVIRKPDMKKYFGPDADLWEKRTRSKQPRRAEGGRKSHRVEEEH